MPTFAIVTLSAFFLTVVQIIAVAQGPVTTLIGAGALPFLNSGILRLFQAQLSRSWIALLTPLIIVTSVVTIMKLGSIEFALFLSTGLAATITATGLQRLITPSRRPCPLCNRRLSAKALVFSCPRCSLLVCEKECWNFESLRCQLCVQNGVPIFSADGRWWDRNFGRFTQSGRCPLCLSSSEEVDLRSCGRCGRPYCRACWDHQNGICPQCGWYPEDLPEPLRVYLISA